MALIVKTNGTVVSVSRSGGTRVATVRFPHSPPPPDFDDVIFEVGVEDYTDLRSALCADPPGAVKVDITYDDSTPTATPQGVKLHR